MTKDGALLNFSYSSARFQLNRQVVNVKKKDLEKKGVNAFFIYVECTIFEQLLHVYE